MRTLRFIVKGQIIEPDPSCDFSGLVPGTVGYLKADFAFSEEWNGCTKVAAFYSLLGKEYPPQILADGRSCFIPKEALAKQTFTMKVIGQRSDFKIGTNKIAIKQDGGGN